MKITKILLWITFIGLALSMIAFGIFGVILFNTGFNAQEAEKSSLEGVGSKSRTVTFKLPMNMEAEYYLRIKDGKVLVDAYFLKIEKKYIPKDFLTQSEISESDYPKVMKGNLYSMPESESYLFIQTPFSTIESALTIWKVYAMLAFSFLIIAVFFTIRFLQNCNKDLFFIAQNSSYLRAISYLAIGYSLMDYAAQWLIYREINSKLEDSFGFSLNSNLEFNWNYFIFSLFLVMIAQAFTEGTKLKEEQSLTI
ncbi:MAG: DUF2975 domain-containing protein [Algoriphagus sp.]|nr:DUF2975 domain-containing protein [Algoriphagus sp.]